jgi:hypothetical protein
MFSINQIILKMTEIKFYTNNMNTEDDFSLSWFWKERRVPLRGHDSSGTELSLGATQLPVHTESEQGSVSFRLPQFRWTVICMCSCVYPDHLPHIAWLHLPLLTLTLKIEAACSSKMLVLCLQQYTASQLRRTQFEDLLP